VASSVELMMQWWAFEYK